MICPVCLTCPAEAFATVQGRQYFRCPTCLATSSSPSSWLPASLEKAHYDHHENDPDDLRYRRFLSRLADPLMARLAPASHGIDYGCGPGPGLAAILREAGHRVDLYDPFYAPDPAPLSQRYDFVVCSEVAEHFHRPAAEFARMLSMLHPGGWLGVMTCFQTDDARFCDWHYRRDPTHVVFYREETMHYIAASHSCSCEIPAKDVALMQRPTGGSAEGSR